MVFFSDPEVYYRMIEAVQREANKNLQEKARKDGLRKKMQKDKKMRAEYREMAAENNRRRRAILFARRQAEK